MPKLAAVYLATGALTEEELNKGIDEMQKRAKETAEGQTPPDLRQVLKDTKKDSPERLASLEQ